MLHPLNAEGTRTCLKSLEDSTVCSLQIILVQVARPQQQLIELRQKARKHSISSKRFQGGMADVT